MRGARGGRVRAWRVREFGSPADALGFDEVDARPPGPGEARVSVAAAGCNFADLLVCAGRYQERPDPPFTLGFEAAGEVVEVGEGTPLGLGARVIVVPELPNGAFQESITVGAGDLYPLPDTVSFATGAVLYVAYATAHVALHHRARLAAGEVVVVTGAAGGVGAAAVQLGVAAGARVVAVVTGADKAAACRGFGAEAVVDLADVGDDALVDAVRAATGGRGADVVIDVVGGPLLERLRRCVAFEGRIVVLGFASGQIGALPTNHVLLRNYAVVGLYLSRYRRENPSLLRQVHGELLDLLAARAIDPPIDRVLPMDQAVAALEAVAERTAVGRIVLTAGT